MGKGKGLRLFYKRMLKIKLTHMLGCDSCLREFEVGELFYAKTTTNGTKRWCLDCARRFYLTDNEEIKEKITELQNKGLVLINHNISS